MPIVFDINVLPRHAASRTRQLRDAFFDAYLAAHPDTHRTVLNLAEDYRGLPVFDEWDISAKFEMLYGEGRLDDVAAERWATLTRLTDQLHAADLIVLSTPMWNFSIPWHLKRWLDCVVQGRLTFEYVDGKFTGLLAGRQLVILTTRDGAYPANTPAAAMDFEMPYLRQIFGFMGLAPIHEVIAEPMMAMGPDVGRQALAEAVERSRILAQSL